MRHIQRVFCVSEHDDCGAIGYIEHDTVADGEGADTLQDDCVNARLELDLFRNRLADVLTELEDDGAREGETGGNVVLAVHRIHAAPIVLRPARSA